MGTKSCTILYIEDNFQSIRILKKALAQHGFYIIAVTDGQTGLSTAKQKQPDIIVLDLNLPDMDGLVVASQLKADSQTRNIPIIMLTTTDSTDAQAASVEIGCAAYLTKPVSLVTLVRTVTDVMRKADNARTGD